MFVRRSRTWSIGHDCDAAKYRKTAAAALRSTRRTEPAMARGSPLLPPTNNIRRRRNGMVGPSRSSELRLQPIGNLAGDLCRRFLGDRKHRTDVDLAKHVAVRPVGAGPAE